MHQGWRATRVLSPRLFCSVLQLAMEDWRCDVSNNGLDLGDGGLLDRRVADDILMFAGSAEQLGYMLDKLEGWSQTQRCKNKGFDNSSATTEDIDDPRWFGDWCWPHRRPINVWAVCWPRLMQAHGRMILTTDYKVRPVHFMFTNGFFATKLSQWHLV